MFSECIVVEYRSQKTEDQKYCQAGNKKKENLLHTIKRANMSSLLRIIIKIHKACECKKQTEDFKFVKELCFHSVQLSSPQFHTQFQLYLNLTVSGELSLRGCSNVKTLNLSDFSCSIERLQRPCILGSNNSIAWI